MSVLNRLQEAQERGEVLRIKYHGGTQPGAVREIYPVRIMGERIIARCLASNAEKTFIVEKIELCESEELSYQLGAHSLGPDEVGYESYAEFCDLHKTELAELGWHVNIEPDCISLHRFFKNGKPRKSSDVSLAYEEYTYDTVIDLGGATHTENARKSLRPWSVRAKNMNTRVFKYLSKATAAFLEQARRGPQN